MKSLLITITSLLISYTLSVCQVTLQWQTPLNQGFNDISTGMVLDGSGNVYVCGVSGITNQGDDLTLVKYNSTGTQQWVRNYNPSAADFNDCAYAVTIDNQNNIIVVGYQENPATGTGRDYAIVKISSTNTLMWSNSYAQFANFEDEALAVAVDNLRNIYVTGRSQGNAAGYDIVTIKFNENGSPQWSKLCRSSANGDDQGVAIAVSGDGFVYVTGFIEIPSSNYNMITLKYNPATGDTLWVNRYDSTGTFDQAKSIRIAGNDAITITGASSSNTSGEDIKTIQYGSAGNVKWKKGYNGPGNRNDRGISVTSDIAGNIYVAGWVDTAVTGTANLDYMTIKYDINGNQVWAQKYFPPQGNNGDDRPCYILTDNSNNVYVTGTCNFVSTFNDYVTVKYNSAGVKLWDVSYNYSPNNDDDNAIMAALDASNNVYVTGYGINTSNNLSDFVTIKYSQVNGIVKIGDETPNSFSLSQNYPNPFNPTTRLRFGIPKGRSELRFVSLKIYDMLGREIETLLNESLQPGTYEVDWDASKYASGVYYYKMVVGDLSVASFAVTGKMVLMK